MKRTLLVLAVSLCHSIAYSQTKPRPKYVYNQSKTTVKPLPTSAANDFIQSAQYQFDYGNGSFKAMVFRYLRSKGYGLPEISVLMENLKPNTKEFNLVLNVVWNYTHERDMLFLNLQSMGIRATNSKTIADYLIANNADQ